MWTDSLVKQVHRDLWATLDLREYLVWGELRVSKVPRGPRADQDHRDRGETMACLALLVRWECLDLWVWPDPLEKTEPLEILVYLDPRDSPVQEVCLAWVEVLAFRDPKELMVTQASRDTRAPWGRRVRLALLENRAERAFRELKGAVVKEVREDHRDPREFKERGVCQEGEECPDHQDCRVLKEKTESLEPGEGEENLAAMEKLVEPVPLVFPEKPDPQVYLVQTV